MKNLLLVINVGSTSIKTQLFDQTLQVKAALTADYGNATELIVTGHDFQGGLITLQKTPAHDAHATLTLLLTLWQQMLTTHAMTVTAIGHRIVHGAACFATITQITPAVLERIAPLDHYAPLHNPLNRLGITLAATYFPDVDQFAVFDTAFHRQLPDYARRYAIPEQLSPQVAFYRYGFHGISCQHSLTTAAQLLECPPSALNLIILHLGGGASITAVRAGISVDTSMGFSPTDGLIMANRCGDLDPMIALTLQREGMSLAQLEHLLNHNSGLMGICGTSDMRQILAQAEHGEHLAQLAVEMFCYRIKKYIGAYCAVLGNVSALIFTGGIGEHAPIIRATILQNLEPLGFAINTTANLQHNGHHSDITATHSRSRILVIHAEEEREIARQMLSFSNDYTHP